MTLTGLSALVFGCLDGTRLRNDELLRTTNSRQPETVQGGKVVARTARTLALNDGVSPKILEAAPRRRQRLSAALVTGPSVLIGKQSVSEQCFSVIHKFEFVLMLTERKEYPVHRLLHPGGHAGTVDSWL